MERNQPQENITENQDEVTKMLGAHVNEELYWQFKTAAAGRGEQLKDAIAHAARMYIDAAPAPMSKRA